MNAAHSGLLRIALRLAVVSLIVMHGASGIAGVVAVAQGASLAMLWDALARAAIIVILAGGWFAPSA
jgi:hypothetical protein